jgi:hypothetical protein
VRPRVPITLAAADLARERPNLERGSLVAPGLGGLPVGTFCDVELALPTGERLTIPARAVLETEAGTVLVFEAHDRAALARSLAAAAAASPAPAAAEPPGEEPEDDPDAGAAAPANVQERLRGLPIPEQLRVAREGTLTERVVLERLYGKVVWEALLRSGHLTVPEVARLARMGTMPRPLLELIVASPAWLQAPQVRRALLSNPRLSQDLVQKVLALLPRDELKLVPQNTAYPAAVRMAAKALAHR